jgi:hypothetical protein
VVESVNAARELAGTYPAISRDYIKRPKSDGYRSLHIVKEYEPISAEDEVYRDCKVEVQIRSRLQHGWAAALETIDFINEERLKLGGGDPDWRSFFLLSANAIAMREDSPLVPGTPSNRTHLAEELRALNEKLNAIHFLRGLHLGAYSAKRAHADAISKGGTAAVYVIVLDMRDKGNIHSKAKGYPEQELQQALTDVLNFEKEFFGDPRRQVIRLSVNKVENIQPAYPAYFMDAQLFSWEIEEFIK